METFFRRLGYAVLGMSGGVVGLFAIVPPQPYPTPDVKLPLADRQPVTTPQYVRTTETFKSEGLECEGWFFMPTKKGSGKIPVMVMGHGMGLQKDCNLEPFIQEFTSKGIAVFAFDYRTFGGSAGVPRQWVSGRRHVQDWHAALTHLRTTKREAVSRLGLWGSSFSGGHVMVVAAQDAEKSAAKKEAGELDRVSCVVSQVPYLGFHKDFLLTTPAIIRLYGLPYVLRNSAAAIRDIAGDTFCNRPYYVKVAGKGNDWGALTTPECEAGYLGLIPTQPRGGWKNMLLGRLGFSILFYRPISAVPKVGCPVCMVVGKQDSLCPVEVARHAATLLGSKVSYHELDTNHFSVYTQPGLGTNLGIQSKFVAQHLLK